MPLPRKHSVLACAQNLASHMSSETTHLSKSSASSCCFPSALRPNGSIVCILRCIIAIHRIDRYIYTFTATKSYKMVKFVHQNKWPEKSANERRCQKNLWPVIQHGKELGNGLLLIYNVPCVIPLLRALLLIPMCHNCNETFQQCYVNRVYNKLCSIVES